jgi:hypothetical protein
MHVLSVYLSFMLFTTAALQTTQRHIIEPDYGGFDRFILYEMTKSELQVSS